MSRSLDIQSKLCLLFPGGDEVLSRRRRYVLMDMRRRRRDGESVLYIYRERYNTECAVLG